MYTYPRTLCLLPYVVVCTQYLWVVYSDYYWGPCEMACNDYSDCPCKLVCNDYKSSTSLFQKENVGATHELQTTKQYLHV